MAPKAIKRPLLTSLAVANVVLIKMLIATNGDVLPRGIDIKQRHLYKKTNGNSFRCIKSGELIPFEDLNDDYCDCLDGSDEPGTSACGFVSAQPNTVTGFWCRNAGHLPQTISATLVDDGICDCCDGTDEKDGNCKNICLEVGAVDRERRKKEMEAANEGFSIRQNLSKQGSEALLAAVEEIKTLEEEVEQLKKQREEHNVIKEDLAFKEKAEKDRCQAIEDEKTAEIEALNTAKRIATAFQAFDLNKDGFISISEIVSFKFLNPERNPAEHEDNDDDPSLKPNYDEDPPFTADMAMILTDDVEMLNFDQFKETLWEMSDEFFTAEGLLREKFREGGQAELGSDLAGSDAQEGGPEQEESLGESDSELSDNDGSKYVSPSELDHDDNEWDGDDNDYDHDNFDNDYAGDGDYDESDHLEYDDEDYDQDQYRKRHYNKFKNDNNNDDDNDSESSTTTGIYDEIAKEAIKLAREARATDTDFENKIRNKETDIKKLQEKQDVDFGPDRAFYSLYNKCIELKTTEYVYELCLFQSATQKQLNGGSRTTLGNWKSPSETDPNGSWSSDHKQMHYQGGVRCWNGPDRSCNVVFSCGTETKILQASEPQRCEYQFDVETPAVCEKVEEEVFPEEADFKDRHHAHQEL